MNMKKIAELLEKEPQFCRSHASYIINLAFVKSIEGLDAILTTGERIPISQTKRKEFMEKMTTIGGICYDIVSSFRFCSNSNRSAFSCSIDDLPFKKAKI